MALKVYDKGDAERLTWITRDSTNALADPTTVALTIRKPDGTSATYTYAGAQIVRDSLGTWHYDTTWDQSGLWEYRWVGTGALALSEEGALWVRYSHF